MGIIFLAALLGGAIAPKQQEPVAPPAVAATQDVAPAARRFLEDGAAGRHPDTPKPGDPIFKNVRSGIIGNNDTAVVAARAGAASLGFREAPPERRLTGEASIEGALLALRGEGLGLPDRLGDGRRGAVHARSCSRR